MPKLSDELAGPLRMMQVRRNLCRGFQQFVKVFLRFLCSGPGHIIFAECRRICLQSVYFCIAK